jgi:FMN-dependent NADH-azoreductase
MKTLLQLNSSIFSSISQFTQFVDWFVSAWHVNESDAQVIVRDFADDSISHLDAQRVLAFFVQPETRTLEQQAYVAEKVRLTALVA